jgi:diguanylate cyclase (GGDEF)-like protein/PAS domain S-box-containing protein
LRLEAALAEADRIRFQYKLLLTSAWEGILGLDRKGNHRFVNPAAARMLGYEVEELMGQRSHATWHRKKADGSPYPAKDCPMQAAIAAGGAQQDTNEVFWRKDGTSLPVEFTCAPIVQGKHALGAVLTFWDISNRRRAEEAQARSLRDDLTGLYNRRGFFTLAQHQFKLCKRSHKGMVLFFADLDALKAINDSLGHLEGDQALIDTANILSHTFRESDIIARLGGDEFVVLITDPSDAKVILRRLCQNLKRHNAKVEQTGEVTRELMEGLRPTVLDHYGLLEGLRRWGKQFSQRTGIKVDIQGEEADPRLAGAAELALFRIAQEALNNVAKHAQASRVVLKEVVDQARVRLDIVDNGIGFDQDQARAPEGRHHWGLMTMNERAMAVGGHCQIKSRPGKGTQVMVEVNR